LSESSQIFAVAVVGLGRIGAGYEPWKSASGKTVVIRNHVDAILATPGLKLTAVAEADQERYLEMEADERFCEVSLYQNLEGLPSDLDIICIATPTAERMRDVAGAIEKTPKLLVVEKPLACTLEDARQLVNAATAKNIDVVVNFPRRLDAEFEKIRKNIRQMPRKVIIRYGKGLKNYASHAVDWLLHWYGAVRAVQAFGDFQPSEDPNFSFVCRMEAGFDAVFLGLDGLIYDQFEIDVIFDDRVLELKNSGIEKISRRPVEDRYIKGYPQLGDAELLSQPRSIGGLIELYQALVEQLKGRKSNVACYAPWALAGMEVLDAVERSATVKGCQIELIQTDLESI